MDPLRITILHNEPNPEYEFHCEAVAACLPDATELAFTRGERPSLDRTDAVVLTGSTCGVYERDDQPWIGDLEALIRTLVERRIPTLGVCFGHQVANTALGGTVEHVGFRAELVAVDFEEDPLFEGVSPIVPVLHGDQVTTPGAGMRPIASAGYYPLFGTRHERAPLWTVQFHPELGPSMVEALRARFDWREGAHSFESVTPCRVFENFRGLLGGR